MRIRDKVFERFTRADASRVRSNWRSNSSRACM